MNPTTPFVSVPSADEAGSAAAEANEPIRSRLSGVSAPESSPSTWAAVWVAGSLFVLFLARRTLGRVLP